MFEVTIPANTNEIGDLDRSQILMYAIANIKPVGKFENFDVKGELNVTFLNENEELKEVDPDTDVM